MKRLCYLLSVICYLSSVTSQAAIPAGYYSSINGKTGDAICTTLHSIIDNHTVISYSGLEPYYAQTDLDSTGHILDVYSKCEFTMSDANCSQKNVCDCWNKEHTVPQSYFGKASPMKSDLFHVLPTDARVNNFRGNYSYGETSSRTHIDGSSMAKGYIGSSNFSGYSGTVYEPDDEFKGDIARIYFYMVTRYSDKNFTQSTPGTAIFTYSGGRAGLTTYGVNLLLKWHRNDPVSQKEIDRNNAVYGIQHNRNPFVDYPCLAEYIWGANSTDALDLSQIMSSEAATFLDPEYNSGCVCHTTQPVLVLPKQSSTIEVGSASIGETVQQGVPVFGVNLIQSLSLSLSGTNASLFSLNKSTISAAEALAGDTLWVSYTPTASGNHTATLTISSTELTMNRVVTLTGSSKAALVTPVTGTDFRLYTEGVGNTVTEQIMVKSTNLTSGLYVGMASNAPKTFSVTPTSLTAAEANAGTVITLTYTPTAIGEESTNLIINSTGKEFNQPTLKVYGSCSFALKDPTDITTSSATLHWTEAGVSQYTVDVFFLQTIEDPEVVILNDTAGSHVTSKSNTYAEKGYIRLGASSKIGSITYAGLDLSQPSTLTIIAKAYNNDQDVKCKVTAGTKDTTITLTSSDASYVINLPALAKSASVTLASTANGKRVLIQNVTVTTGGIKEVREHVLGYPKSETGGLSHVVLGLSPDTEYSYTIKPQGLSESDIQTFTTDSTSTALPTTPYHLPPATCSKFLTPSGQLRLYHNGHTYTPTGALVQ